MIVYGNPVSPYVRKVIFFAAEKRVERDLQDVKAAGEAFAQASPFRKIPALRDGDFTVSDSSAIVAYLDDAEGSKLIPTERQAKARAIWFDEFADTSQDFGCHSFVPFVRSEAFARPALGQRGHVPAPVAGCATHSAGAFWKMLAAWE